MAVRLSPPPRLNQELRTIQEVCWRLEEILPHLGPAEGPARRALGLIEEAQQFLRSFVHPSRWPKRKRWRKAQPEEKLISVQDSLAQAITMIGFRMRRHARLEFQRVVALLKEAASLCAVAELEYLFSLGLPRDYRLWARVKPGFLDELGSLFGAILLYVLSSKVFPDGSRAQGEKEYVLFFALGMVWRVLAKKLGPGPGIWWPKRRYVWRSVAPYFVFITALAGVWLAERQWEYWLGLAAIFVTGLAFPLLRRIVRALRAPKGTLIRCTRFCHSFFAPGGKILPAKA